QTKEDIENIAESVVTQLQDNQGNIVHEELSSPEKVEEVVTKLEAVKTPEQVVVTTDAITAQARRAALVEQDPNHERESGQQQVPEVSGREQPPDQRGPGSLGGVTQDNGQPGESRDSGGPEGVVSPGAVDSGSEAGEGVGQRA